MHILIVSDIHANIVALETVMAAAGDFDDIWCLGDTIGYGPKPNECVAHMIPVQHAISGNHDWACIGKIDLNDFNPDARVANQWNGEQLTPAHLDWLRSLDTRIEHIPINQPGNDGGDFACSMAHGSPREPVWEYLLTVDQALPNFADSHFRTKICFIGHSHIPVSFCLDSSGRCERLFPDPGQTLDLNQDARFIINPGSVGQPRNQDPRAAFAIFDTEAGTIQFQRVDYDFAQTQEQMRDVGLPVALVRRLAFGI